MKVSAQELARLLWEEFDRGAWGDIDPDLFRIVAENNPDEQDGENDDIAAMREVLERVASRLPSDHEWLP